jgi:hypothetical protein
MAVARHFSAPAAYNAEFFKTIWEIPCR